MLNYGLAKVDITPRVGVELYGFGCYLHRCAKAVRTPLYARALAVCDETTSVVVVSCDLVGLRGDLVEEARARVTAASGVPGDHLCFHCTHTHSGPASKLGIGQGEPDVPYLEVLPTRLAEAALAALADLSPARLHHAAVPCEGLGYNREHDQRPALEEALREDWRPAKPELTDTTCHVLTAVAGEELLGFVSYFGCHPVTCCEETRAIHGDYAGVATNLLEREHPGAVGLFLQGAQGDVNTCVVHKPEPEALLALDVIAGRYARAVRAGIAEAQPLAVDALRHASHHVSFTRRPLTADDLRERLAGEEAVMYASGATDHSAEVRMATVRALAYRRLIATLEAGGSVAEPTELQGFALGAISLLGTPFEVFQAIKNDVREAARPATALVMGLTNDCLGYTPDRTAAARGGYAADTVPLMLGQMPFSTGIHDELVRELTALEAMLRA